MTATLPCPTSDPTAEDTAPAHAWRPLNTARSAWALGNRLLVEELGPTSPGRRCWRWRVAAIGGDTGMERERTAAFRAAEFALGIAEQPVLNLIVRNPSQDESRPEQLTI